MIYKCWEQFRSPAPGSLPYYLGFYVFPLLFIVGVGGNLLNLLVFTSPGMRSSKANCFLSSMAVADLGFFITMFILNSSIYEVLFQAKYFVAFYVYSKSSFLALSNWSSAASIWFAVMVTVERLIAIRFPLKIRSLWTRRRITFLISFITLITLMLQTYHILWLKPGTLPSCKKPNETVYVLMTIFALENSTVSNFVRTSMYISPIVNVLIPLVIMGTLNGLLVYYLRQNSHQIIRLGNINDKNNTKERKVTIMVLIIVSAFFVCNMPSAVVYVVSQFLKINFWGSLTNYLVCLNKALNFLLYCCASKSFRKKCKTILLRFYERVFHCGRRTREIEEENGLLMTQMSQTIMNIDTTHTKLINVSRCISNDNKKKSDSLK